MEGNKNGTQRSLTAECEERVSRSNTFLGCWDEKNLVLGEILTKIKTNKTKQTFEILSKVLLLD